MRRSNSKIKGQKLKVKVIYIFVLILFLVFSFLIFIFFKVVTLEKFIYVNKASDGSAEIISDSFKYKIPADTELESARRYGKYKLSSLWQLSEKDEVGGKLITETIVKNYSLPVFLWKDKNKSNLNIYQKIQVFFNGKKKNIDFIISSSKIPSSILIQFVDPTFIEVTPKIDVYDLTGSLNTLDRVSKIIEVMGGKITSNSKGYDENLNCEILSNDLKLARIFANILDCKVLESDSSTLRIKLGAKFVDRF